MHSLLCLPFRKLDRKRFFFEIKALSEMLCQAKADRTEEHAASCMEGLFIWKCTYIYGIMYFFTENDIFLFFSLTASIILDMTICFQKGSFSKLRRIKFSLFIESKLYFLSCITLDSFLTFHYWNTNGKYIYYLWE